MRSRKSINGNIVMSAVRWLGRTPESLVPNHPFASRLQPMPPEPPGVLCRFDARALYANGDEARVERGLEWRDVADATGLTEGQLRGLATRDGVSFPGVMRVTTWVERPAADFIVEVPL